jgi:hypothetical protein
MIQCYLCGDDLIKNQNKSKDHVPPDCIFPENKPLNLITVPCCTNCNKKYQQLDERMRDYFVLVSGEKSGDARDILRRKLSRNPRWLDVILSYTKEHPTLVENTGNPRRVFYFDDGELNPWLIRVVKGLFYKRSKTRISDFAKFTVYKYPQIIPQPSYTFPMENGLEYRPYFTYGVISEQNNDFWVLVFYDYLMFSVSVDDPIH